MARLPILLLLFVPLAFGADTRQAVLDSLDAHPWKPQAESMPQSTTMPDIGAPPPPRAAAPAAHPAARDTVPLSQAMPATPMPAIRNPESTRTTFPEDRWEVQLGALSSRKVAEERARQLERRIGRGDVRVVDGGKIFKLRWGDFPNRAGADEALQELRQKGIDGFVAVAPGR